MAGELGQEHVLRHLQCFRGFRFSLEFRGVFVEEFLSLERFAGLGFKP